MALEAGISGSSWEAGSSVWDVRVPGVVVGYKSHVLSQVLFRPEQPIQCGMLCPVFRLVLPP